MRLALCALIALAPFVSAQPATLTGQVLDAETGEPLAGANVYLSGTTIGDAADAEGWFSFTSPVLGEVVLVASMVGYTAAEEAVRLEPGAALRRYLRPRPQLVVSATAVVDRARDTAWPRQLARFRDLFLGETPNARATEFENPAVLSFSESGSVLRASADAPLTAVNHRLGYRLEWASLSFQGDDALRRWSGDLRFEPLDGDAEAQAGWARARRQAYGGSWRHFLDALRAGTTSEEGYDVFPVRWPGQSPRVAYPISADSIATALTAAPRRVWLVVYYDEAAPRETRAGSYRRILGARRSDRVAQRSWVTIGVDGLQFGHDGRLANAERHVLSGYWDYERAADLLPLDYVPDEAGER